MSNLGLKMRLSGPPRRAAISPSEVDQNGLRIAQHPVPVDEDRKLTPRIQIRERLAFVFTPQKVHRDDFEVDVRQCCEESNFVAVSGCAAPRFRLFKAATGQELTLKLPKDVATPQPGAHIPRALAKALGAVCTHVGDKPIGTALQHFVEQVKKSTNPATVLVVFGLAGGTGSGMAVDIARTLKAQLPPTVQVAGLGQLSHSGDGEYYNSLAQTMALEDIDTAMRGDAAANPFPAGFVVVSTEHSWQRLTAYTSTGVKEVRQRFKQMVTNRFVADSFMRWALEHDGEHLARTLSRSGGKWMLFDVAKLTHPGVQVLPGEAGSKWDSVLQQWIGFTPQFAGLSDGFKTDYVEIHVHAPRDMRIDMIDAEMRKVVGSRYLNGNGSSVATFQTEFFDALTAYANVILWGTSKEDLTAYGEAKAGVGKSSAAAKALESA